MYTGERYFFSREHNVTKKEPDVFRTERQRFACCSTNYAFNAPLES